MKIAILVGTRPELVQAEPLLRTTARQHTALFIHTGQHYDRSMSELIRRSVGLRKPRYVLGVGSASHAEQTARVMERLGPVLEKERPDCVLVYGDTNSTLAGALAAVKLHVQVAHVEAGLRSFNRRMPEEVNRVVVDRLSTLLFCPSASKLGIPLAHVEAGLRSYNRSMPEELNRITVDHLSDFLFCPTANSVRNLRKEGIRRGVHLVGDVMYDSARHWHRAARARDLPRRLGLEREAYLLLTLHRPGNVDDPRVLSRVLRTVAKSDRFVLFPIHPRTRARLRQSSDGKPLPGNLRIVEPLSYLDFLSALMNSKMVLTDSGGVQKQAYFFRIPCVTLRRETEWVETVETGWNTLVGTDSRALLRAIRDFRPARRHPELYGNGHAAAHIVRVLEKNL